MAPVEVTDFGTNRKLIYDSYMSDYYELTSYRAPFPIAFDRSKIALSGTLACV